VTKLADEPDVIRLASELGVDWRNPVDEILKHCAKRIRRWVQADGPVRSIAELEQLVCRHLHLVFEEVWTEGDLDRLIQKYVALGEYAFASLRMQFDEETWGALLERGKVDGSAPDRYIAIIDCRGPKRARRFFTRWHEIAHLLTQHRQLQLPLCVFRTGTTATERLMDAIAGKIGFYEPIFKPGLSARLRAAHNRLSFELVEEMRQSICPDASFQATLCACVQHAESPIIYVECGMGYKKSEDLALRSKQASMFGVRPEKKLRVVRVVANEAARTAGHRVDPNMAVPHASILYFGVLPGGTAATDTSRVGTENLQTWKHSNGTTLKNLEVEIEARVIVNRVVGILQPARREPSRSRVARRTA
jgi:hypothetical protein